MRGARHWVVSSIGPEGPQSAVVGVAVTERLELVFDTLGSTRKASNLRRDPRASLVVWRGDATAQIEGIGDEPTGAELERVREAYFATFPDGRERATWEGITYFRVRPTWIRTSEFGESGPRVRELAGDTLAALLR
ncbi:MAG: hypothetical protein HOW73_37840 [Polyangiaceae bacterium]|nr:hypothetical protein [Polyangiaceae bacterium]